MIYNKNSSANRKYDVWVLCGEQEIDALLGNTTREGGNKVSEVGQVGTKWMLIDKSKEWNQKTMWGGREG